MRDGVSPVGKPAHGWIRIGDPYRPQGRYQPPKAVSSPGTSYKTCVVWPSSMPRRGRPAEVGYDTAGTRGAVRRRGRRLQFEALIMTLSCLGRPAP